MQFFVKIFTYTKRCIKIVNVLTYLDTDSISAGCLAIQFVQYYMAHMFAS